MDLECNLGCHAHREGGSLSALAGWRISGTGVIAALGATVNYTFVKSSIAAIAQHSFAERPDPDALVA
jgi:hypothetical protein